MNKTFLLSARASYTEGSMLIVVESIEKFIDLYKKYWKKVVPILVDFESTKNKKDFPSDKWYEFNESFSELKNTLMKQYGSGFDFDIETGTSYIKDGQGKGNYKNNISIISQEEYLKKESEECWVIEKEFLSDLPTGTHYYGDYCA
jgi:hypothetical protein